MCLDCTTLCFVMWSCTEVGKCFEHQLTPSEKQTCIIYQVKHADETTACKRRHVYSLFGPGLRNLAQTFCFFNMIVFWSLLFPGNSRTGSRVKSFSEASFCLSNLANTWTLQPWRSSVCHFKLPCWCSQRDEHLAQPFLSVAATGHDAGRWLLRSC